jgi:histidine triad (HIT) family protein
MTVQFHADDAAPCVFCAIIAGTAPAAPVWSDTGAYAFMDLRQPNPGHVLITPRRHVARLHELEPDEAAVLMRGAVLIARALREAVGMDAYSLWQSNGIAAGQEVMHVHLHISPRLPADGLMRIYPNDVPKPMARDALAQLAERVRRAMPGGGRVEQR